MKKKTKAAVIIGIPNKSGVFRDNKFRTSWSNEANNKDAPVSKRIYAR